MARLFSVLFVIIVALANHALSLAADAATAKDDGKRRRTEDA